jgi:hypothetical protein
MGTLRLVAVLLSLSLAAPAVAERASPAGSRVQARKHHKHKRAHQRHRKRHRRHKRK